MILQLNHSKHRNHALHLLRKLTRQERIAWGASLFLVTGTNLAAGRPDSLTLAAAWVGITSLLFAAKGQALAQLLMTVFSLLYGPEFCDLLSERSLRLFLLEKARAPTAHRLKPGAFPHLQAYESKNRAGLIPSTIFLRFHAFRMTEKRPHHLNKHPPAKPGVFHMRA